MLCAQLMMYIRCVWDRASPVKMSASQVSQVSAGSNHTVLLTTDGRVLTCGSNLVSNNVIMMINQA